MIDGDGHTWPVQASGYNEARASVSYLFEDALPPGHYTVQLPEEGGLVDLAGLSPIAPGEPTGVLGAFDVAPASSSGDPQDLGAILPGAAAAGRTVQLTLGPGDVVTDRVVITVPAIYQFELQSDEAFLSAQITGAGATQIIDPQSTTLVQLVPGEYLIRTQNLGTAAIHAELNFRASAVMTELFLASGVGQGPGLSLRLIEYPNPTIPSPTVFPIGPPPVSTFPAPIETPGVSHVTATGNDPGTGAPIVSALSMSPSLNGAGSPIGPAAAISFLGMGSDLIGRPFQAGARGSLTDLVNSSPSEVMALTGINQGQQPGLSRDLWTRRDTSQLDVPDAASEVLPARGRSMAAIASFDPGRVIPLIGSILDWTLQMTTTASARFATRPNIRSSADASPTNLMMSAVFYPSVRRENLTDGVTDLDQIDTNDDADSWADFLSPVVVAPFGGPGRACKLDQMTRWRIFRERARKLRITRWLNRGSLSSQPVSPHQVDSWFDESDVDVELLLPISQAS